jgi:putative membrane protein
MHQAPSSESPAAVGGDPDPPSRSIWLRLLFGGGMMGLANLVPGISGGTMLVAAGVYRRFIDAVSNISRLRLDRVSLITVAIVACGVVLAVAGFAAVVSEALVRARWAMYALFIGLTLGGVPILWRSIRPASLAVWIAAAAGAAAMVALALLQDDGGEAGPSGGLIAVGVAGAAGAAAMILPGVSGAYLLLLLGQYRTILEAIREGASAASSFDLERLWTPVEVLLPFGVGVLVGLVLVSNLLRWLIRRFERATLGVLLGLLLGAPAGLYPFKQGVPPMAGDVIRGEVLTEAEAAELLEKPKAWPERRYPPSPGQVAGALGLVLVGVGITVAIGRLGREETAGAGPGR